MSLFFNPLVTRDSDGTIFEVLGEGKDYEGQPKIFISKQGSVGWHRITQDQLWVNFTAYPAPGLTGFELIAADYLREDRGFRLDHDDDPDGPLVLWPNPMPGTDLADAVRDYVELGERVAWAVNS